jgi:hypothetical protein
VLLGGLLLALAPVALLVGMVALVWLIVRGLTRPALA